MTHQELKKQAEETKGIRIYSIKSVFGKDGFSHFYILKLAHFLSPNTISAEYEKSIEADSYHQVLEQL